MNWNDVELRLLAGRPVEIEGNGLIYVPKIKQIIDIGESKYNEILSLLLFNKDRVKDIEVNDLTDFELLCVFYVQDEHIKELLNHGFQLYFRDIPRLGDDGSDVFFYFGDILDHIRLNKDNFAIFQEVIRKINFIKLQKEDEYRPANDRAKKMIEMILKNKKNKPQPKEKMNLQSIISGLSWKSNSINLFNIFDLTIYQLYDGFFRIDNIDNYHNTLSGIYAGTIDGKKINLQNIHWSNILKL